ncbi:MAG: DUF349 domain-containing protein [Gammaproteobacteria bacterium]|nr:DUF349 domain-containing protein [Gammaproteobacteria bacterium]
MISRRFRNRVNLSGGSAPAIAARIESLEPDDVSIYRKDLAELAHTSESYDRSIRLAAIAKLDDLGILTDLLTKDAELARAAANAIARLMHQGNSEQVDALFESVPVKLAFVRAIRDEASAAPLLDTLDEASLAAVACEASHAGVRRAAADLVTTEAILNDLAGKAKNRDKNVYRAARTRLDRIRSTRRTLLEANTRAEDIAARIEELSRMPMDRTFDARLNIIEQEWQECESARDHALDACPQLRTAFPRLAGSKPYTHAMEVAKARRSKESHVRSEQSEQTETPSARARDVPQPEKNRLVRVEALSPEETEHIEALLQDAPPTFNAPKHIDDYRQIWQQAGQLASMRKRLESFTHRVNAALSANLNAWLRAASDYSAATDALERELLTRFDETAATLKSEIELGRLGKASDLRRECGDTLRLLSQSRARKLWKRLRDTDKDIQRLRDWQAYAATPKRESLCERMAEIAENPLPSDEQVDHIRLLREEWKATGPFSGARDHELRRRFERLAESAYAPCREHFGQQAELRKRNLATRKQICEDLERYIEQKDWKNPNWKSVDQILRTARNEWRDAYPVERAKVKALQKRFDSLCDDLFSRLSGHWKGSEVKARGLISELRALLESTTSTERLVEGTTAIQARWREVGAMSYSANRKLWKEFRGLCDQVYSQRRTVKTQENEAYQDRLSRAHELIQRLELTLANVQAQTATPSEMSQFSNEWEAFKDMRGESFKRIDAKWRDLSRRYRQLLREGDAARQLELLDLAEQIDSGLGDAEQSLLQGEAIDTTALATLTEISARLFGKASLARLARLQDAHAGQLTEADLEASLAERRRMCVMLDIYLERESPPEDKALRLKIQVERINRGASGTQIEQQDPTEVARDWCRAGPVAAAGKQLNARFFSAVKELTA